MADQQTPAPAPNPEPGTVNPNPSTQHPEPGTANDRISIDTFMNVELRTAKVIAAEAVPKSKKLIKLQVDLGTEQRTILAGIAEAYQPESLVGRTIVIVANLKPAKLMGIESNGMVLAAGWASRFRYCGGNLTALRDRPIASWIWWAPGGALAKARSHTVRTQTRSGFRTHRYGVMVRGRLR